MENNSTNDYQIISRPDYTVLIDGEKVKCPVFTEKATPRYRLTPDYMLQKQCVKCQNWYSIAAYKAGEWVEVWNQDYHKSKSNNYHSYCRICRQNEDKAKKNQTQISSLPSHGSTQTADGQADIRDNNSDKKRHMLRLDDDVMKYLTALAIQEGKPKGDLANMIMRQEMLRSPLDIELIIKKLTGPKTT